MTTAERDPNGAPRPRRAAAAQRRKEVHMTRTLVVSILLGIALVSAGCSERRLPRQWERVTGEDRDRDRVDLNSASERQLTRLPGISDDDANRIIANRPYPDKEALVRRGVIGPRKYDAIEEYVYAGERRRHRDDDDRYRRDDRDDRYDRYDHR
jgi:hypothetical protein